MSGAASVSVELLQLVGQYATSRGVPAQRILEELGVDPQVVPGARLPQLTFAAAFDALADASGDVCFGLHLGQAVSLASTGHVVFGVMRNSPTVEAAIVRFFRYHALLADALVPSLQVEGRHTGLVLEVRAGAPMSRHHSEAVMAMLVALLRGLAERPIAPLRIDFAHAAPDDASEHGRVLGAPVRFARREAALRVLSADLSTPVFLANPALLTHLEQFAQALLERLRGDDSCAGRTSRRIAQQLAAGERPSLEDAARAGGVGPRQLQNRLRAEGVTFQRLLDGVRRDLASGHLNAGRHSICDVAFMLGFSEQSAFQRAFKRWTGTTPGQAQRRRRATVRARRR